MSKETRKLFDPNVDYSSLKKHRYKDCPGETFYTCTRCGGEYLGSMIVEERGETMCIDCWNRIYG